MRKLQKKLTRDLKELDPADLFPAQLPFIEIGGIIEPPIVKIDNELIARPVLALAVNGDCTALLYCVSILLQELCKQLQLVARNMISFAWFEKSKLSGENQ